MENPTTFALVRSPAPIITFPAPASSNAACGFPALRFPACFTSRVMRPIQPSPSRISFASGRAVRSAPFSSRLCLPCRQSRYRQQGRFPPPALPGFTGTFPGAAGYTAYLCSADFSTGRGGLLQLLSASSSPYRLPPRRSAVAPQPVCATPCCFRPRLEDSASGPSISRPPVRLRSGNSPTTPYGGLTPAGLSPAERASLCWTHKSLIKFSWLPRPCAIRNTCSLLRFELLTTIQ